MNNTTFWSIISSSVPTAILGTLLATAGYGYFAKKYPRDKTSTKYIITALVLAVFIVTVLSKWNLNQRKVLREQQFKSAIQQKKL